MIPPHEEGTPGTEVGMIKLSVEQFMAIVGIMLAAVRGFRTGGGTLPTFPLGGGVKQMNGGRREPDEGDGTREEPMSRERVGRVDEPRGGDEQLNGAGGRVGKEGMGERGGKKMGGERASRGEGKGTGGKGNSEIGGKAEEREESGGGSRGGGSEFFVATCAVPKWKVQEEERRKSV